VAVELFGTAVTRPAAAFCDTSFLLDLLTHELASVGPLLDNLPPHKAARAADAATFFHTYARAGTRFISSPYAFQELMLVLGKGVLRTNPGKHKRWKDLEAADPATFRSLHAAWVAVVEDSWERMQHRGVWFTVPSTGQETAHGTRVDSEVVEAATLIKRRYPSLDPADALHIAMGVASGVDWFVTVDEPWKAVKEINVFCHR
jgi:hypothetical protein